MKICLRSCLLCKSKLFYILNLLLATINMSIWCVTFQNSLVTNGNTANARCIHDELRFAIKDQSPQLYHESKGISQERTSTKVSNKKDEISQNLSIEMQSSSVQNENKSQLETYQLAESEFNSSLVAKVQQVNLESFSSNVASQYSTNVSSSHPVQHHSTSFSTLHNISRFRRSNSNSSFSVFESYETFDHVAITETEENFNPVSLLMNSTYYKPIRLTVWYDFNHIEFANTSVEFERLKQGFDLANEELVKLLSVIPVRGNLLLKRVTACGSYWLPDSLASNKQKCARISGEYSGEKCFDDFQVPDHHLSGFSTYDKEGEEPSRIHYEDGVGVPDSDIVVYVRSRTTERCFDGNVVAYAASCQLDQFYRPIAGFANFCPSYLSSSNFDAEKFYLTVLHELFHILGFSRSLFKNFQACHLEETADSKTPSGEVSLNLGNTTLVCSRRSGVVDYVDGRHRILSPTVATEAARHFNCSTIGGPLESYSQNYYESSHWDSRFFQSSIMTSSIGKPHLTIIDRMTAALFSDTGWYRVNMSQASHMFWGKGAGCEFGDLDYCHSGENPFFCSTSNQPRGCHYLHLDKGVCKSSQFLDSCSIYQAQPDGACWNPTNQKSNDLSKGEVFGASSRCFVSNITRHGNSSQVAFNRSKRSLFDGEGRCYEMRCNDTQTLEIKVKGADWVLCKSKERVNIPGYKGFIICPPTSLMCDQELRKRTRIYTGPTVCVKIVLLFPTLNEHIKSLTSSQSESSALLKLFTKKLVSFVDPLINATNTSVLDPPHAAENSVFIDLKTAPFTSRSCPQAVRRLQKAVNDQTLTVEFTGKSFTAIRLVSTYTLQPCSASPQFNNDSLHFIKKPETPRKPTSGDFPGGHVSAGIIAAAAVGAVSISVLASVSLILYLKSIAQNTVSPDMGIGPEVSYQPPNSRGSPPSVSESGSVGQIQFTV